MSPKRTFTVFAFAAAGFLATSLCAAADDQSEALRKRVNELMQTTTVVAVMDVAAPDKFVPDTDPNTLQIVYIADPKAGTNHVSDDGEVIWFFGDPSVNAQQPYIFKAFEIRAKKQLGMK